MAERRTQPQHASLRHASSDGVHCCGRSHPAFWRSSHSCDDCACTVGSRRPPAYVQSQEEMLYASHASACWHVSPGLTRSRAGTTLQTCASTATASLRARMARSSPLAGTKYSLLQESSQVRPRTHDAARSSKRRAATTAEQRPWPQKSLPRKKRETQKKQ